MLRHIKKITTASAAPPPPPSASSSSSLRAHTINTKQHSHYTTTTTTTTTAPTHNKTSVCIHTEIYTRRTQQKFVVVVGNSTTGSANGSDNKAAMVLSECVKMTPKLARACMCTMMTFQCASCLVTKGISCAFSTDVEINNNVKCNNSNSINSARKIL